MIVHAYSRIICDACEIDRQTSCFAELASLFAGTIQSTDDMVTVSMVFK
jgi:hypothetical protein